MASTLPLPGSLTVLMIDDNPEDLESWSRLLGESLSRYLILKAQTVRAALDLCEYQTVDCVVLDIDMEHSSGFEVLLRLIPNHKHPKVAVVVLTRLRNASLHNMALYHGAQACLVKQLTSARDLDEAIQKAVISVVSNAN